MRRVLRQEKTYIFAYLLHVYVNTRQPTPETRVRVIPPNNHFRTSCLFEQVDHLRLKDVVDTLYGISGATLRHSKDVDDLDSVLVDKFA